jgi:uncharacterized membrane protein YdjX (TVP38/TMEM64 family)
LLIGPVVAGHYLNLGEWMSLEGIRDAIHKTGRWQFAAFTAGYCVAALTPIPAALLSTASGALWGPYLGTVATVISATFAACLPFLLARLLGRGTVGKLLMKHSTADRCDRFAGRNGFAVVLTMRLIPVIPWDFINFLSGLCGIRFRDYLTASIVGTIPASFAYNLIGASLGKPLDKTPIVVLTGIVMALAVVPIMKRRNPLETKP